MSRNESYNYISLLLGITIINNNNNNFLAYTCRESTACLMFTSFKSVHVTMLMCRGARDWCHAEGRFRLQYQSIKIFEFDSFKLVVVSFDVL